MTIDNVTVTRKCTTFIYDDVKHGQTAIEKVSAPKLKLNIISI